MWFLAGVLFGYWLALAVAFKGTPDNREPYVAGGLVLLGCGIAWVMGFCEYGGGNGDDEAAS